MMKGPSDRTTPLRLDEGLYPENSRILLPWRTPWNIWAEWRFPKNQVILPVSERFVEQFSFAIAWRGKNSHLASTEEPAGD